ncbi:hypothetical protein ACIQ62_09420 [Streptomyces sp. NPDC096319]|uniref:hypothetical protein n=1 Tax=Streptomyces sp. NPDC096319 TaxID=3366084 RepID=UPI0038230FE2
MSARPAGSSRKPPAHSASTTTSTVRNRAKRPEPLRTRRRNGQTVRHHGNGSEAVAAVSCAAHVRQKFRPGAFGVPHTGQGAPDASSSTGTGRTTGRAATAFAGCTGLGEPSPTGADGCCPGVAGRWGLDGGGGTPGRTGGGTDGDWAAVRDADSTTSSSSSRRRPSS